MAAFGGFYESPGPPPSGDALGILPRHCDGHRMASKVGTFCIVLSLIVALAVARAIRSE